MPTLKEDNDEERLARIDAIVEAHKRLTEGSNGANTLARLAQVRARVAQALAIELHRTRAQRRRTRRRA